MAYLVRKSLRNRLVVSRKLVPHPLGTASTVSVIAFCKSVSIQSSISESRGYLTHRQTDKPHRDTPMDGNSYRYKFPTASMTDVRIDNLIGYR